MKTLMKVLGIMMIALVALTACSPNPGQDGNNDKNKFEVPPYMTRNKLGNYTLYMYDEVTEKDIEAGTMSITEEDITINLDLGGTDVKFFGGSTNSLKEFYNMAWNADKNSAYIVDSAAIPLVSFFIGGTEYRFDWQSSSLHNGMGVLRSIGGGASSTYYMQSAN